MLINKIDTVKGKSKKAFENFLRFIPDCLRISSSLKFRAKEIRKNNKIKNKEIAIKNIVITTLPIKESRSKLFFLCALSLGLYSYELLYKTIDETKNIVLIIDKTNKIQNFLEFLSFNFFSFIRLIKLVIFQLFLNLPAG